MSSKFKCEYCGKEHDGKYGSGRFCSAHCARGYSTLGGRSEINKKRQKTARKNYIGSAYHRELLRKAQEKAIKTVHKNRMKRRFKIAQTELDITNGELEEYRKIHTVCEICGKPEKVRAYKGKKSPNKLAIDHNHNTNHFRGLLCCDCNRKLGWFENLSDNILRYLKDKDGYMVELANTPPLQGGDSEFESRCSHQ